MVYVFRATAGAREGNSTLLNDIAAIGSSYQLLGAIAGVAAFFGVLLTIRLQRDHIRWTEHQAQVQTHEFTEIMSAQKSQMQQLTAAVGSFEAAASSTGRLANQAIAATKALAEEASKQLNVSTLHADLVSQSVRTAAQSLAGALSAANELVLRQTQFGEDFQRTVNDITKSIKEQRESILGINQAQEVLVESQRKVVEKQERLLDSQEEYIGQQKLAIELQQKLNGEQLDSIVLMESHAQLQNLRAVIDGMFSTHSSQPVRGTEVMAQAWRRATSILELKHRDLRDAPKPETLPSKQFLADRTKSLHRVADELERSLLPCEAALDRIKALAEWMAGQELHTSVASQNSPVWDTTRRAILANVPRELRSMLFYMAVCGKLSPEEVVVLSKARILSENAAIYPEDRQLLKQ